MAMQTKPKPKGKQAAEAERPVRYPTLMVNEVPVEPAIMDFDTVVAFMGIETEEQYKARTGEASGLTEKKLAKSGIHATFTNCLGEKCVAWNNVNNRPLRLGDVYKYKQDMLDKCWADSRNGEGMTANGEPFIVSRTGITLSFQHRGWGYYDAVLEWRKNPERFPKWAEEPTIEALIVTGVSEHPRGSRPSTTSARGPRRTRSSPPTCSTAGGS